MEVSAGCIITKNFSGIPHVLLVHPTGGYWVKGFGFPKGKVEEGEDLKTAALRETEEETGIVPDILDNLGSVTKKTDGKEVHAFIALYKSGNLEGKKAVDLQKAEVDIAKFYPIEQALTMVYSYQKPLLEKAKRYIEEQKL